MKEETLWKRYWRNKSTTNRNALVVYYLPILKLHVHRMLRRFDSSVQYDDLFSAASVGCIKAIEAYDSKQSKFATYLTLRVRGEILDWARSVDHQPRKVRNFDSHRQRVTDKMIHEYPMDYEIADAMGLSISRYRHLSRLFRHGTPLYMDVAIDDPTEWEDCRAVNPDENVSLEWLEGVLGEYLSTKEKVAFFETYVRGISCKKVGEILGYSPSRISQLRLDALKKIKARFVVDRDLLVRNRYVA